VHSKVIVRAQASPPQPSPTGGEGVSASSPNFGGDAMGGRQIARVDETPWSEAAEDVREVGGPDHLPSCC